MTTPKFDSHCEFTRSSLGNIRTNSGSNLLLFLGGQTHTHNITLANTLWPVVVCICSFFYSIYAHTRLTERLGKLKAANNSPHSTPPFITDFPPPVTLPLQPSSKNILPKHDRYSDKTVSKPVSLRSLSRSYGILNVQLATTLIDSSSISRLNPKISLFWLRLEAVLF